jgi:hypothetical protein
MGFGFLESVDEKCMQIELVNYLVATKKLVDLIINFGEKKVLWQVNGSGNRECDSNKT